MLSKNYSGLTESQSLDLMVFHYHRYGLKKPDWMEMHRLAHVLNYDIDTQRSK